MNSPPPIPMGLTIDTGLVKGYFPWDWYVVVRCRYDLHPLPLLPLKLLCKIISENSQDGKVSGCSQS